MDTPPLLYKSVHVTFVFWVPKTPPPTPYMSGTFVLAPPPPPPPRLNKFFHRLYLFKITAFNYAEDIAVFMRFLLKYVEMIPTNLLSP